MPLRDTYSDFPDNIFIFIHNEGSEKHNKNGKQCVDSFTIPETYQIVTVKSILNFLKIS